MTTSTAPIVRLLLASTVVSVAALGTAMYGLLHAPPRSAVAATDELAAVHKELAELRHSIELTRSQLGGPSNTTDLADAERRIASLETGLRTIAARPGASTRPTATDPLDADDADDDSDHLADGTQRFTSLRAPSSAVTVRQLPGGALAVSNRDPELTGQAMVIQGRTPDGSDKSVTVTVPPPS